METVTACRRIPAVAMFQRTAWFREDNARREPSPSTNGEYGAYLECAADISATPRRSSSRHFTQHMSACGMYRNTTLNTALDKTIA